MTGLRLATYNVEWFNALFDDQGRMLTDREPSTRYKISRGEQLAALGTVFKALDADGITIVEAPDTSHKRSTVTALETFARANRLRARKALIGYPSETEQEIAFLYDPDRLTARHDPQGTPSTSAGSSDAPRFDTTFRYELDGDSNWETIRFSKPPLELAITTSGGTKLRLIGVHAKSKNPYGVTGVEAQKRLSIQNRRKQLAQCLWLRQRVETHLAAKDSLLVMGDFNDGPGIDEYEKLFGQSGIEIVLGSGPDPALNLTDPHASMALQSKVGLTPTSARFYLAPQKRYFEALLDFLMVSPDLAARGPDWRIWHPFNEPKIADIPGLSAALLQASDHFPVSIDLPDVI
jgi:hypothetical protein